MAEIAAGAARGKRIEIWFQDEARIGQKNKITRRWARRGTRPSAPHDQRTRSAYIFGAICPKLGKAAALVMPWCDTYAMTQHLAEIARHVDADAHAILIMDQAGWHMSNNLVVPENRGGSVCLNSFGRFAKWISASIMPPPSLVSAR